MLKTDNCWNYDQIRSNCGTLPRHSPHREQKNQVEHQSFTWSAAIFLFHFPPFLLKYVNQNGGYSNQIPAFNTLEDVSKIYNFEILEQQSSHKKTFLNLINNSVTECSILIWIKCNQKMRHRENWFTNNLNIKESCYWRDFDKQCLCVYFILSLLL